ncbi:MAG: hypothetical protein ACYC2O_06880, partial [Microthrixaceae bacterium]
MVEGWKLFLFNLQLHCRHFADQDAVSMLPMGPTSLPRAAAWTKLCQGLHIPEAPTDGDRIEARTDDGARLAGTVVTAGTSSIALLLDAPAPGTAFLTVEGDHGGTVSVWAYLYGPDAQTIVERDKPRWSEWLATFDAP